MPRIASAVRPIERLRAVAALQDERLAPGHGGQPVLQAVAFTGEHQRRYPGDLAGDGRDGRRIRPVRLLRGGPVPPPVKRRRVHPYLAFLASRTGSSGGAASGAPRYPVTVPNSPARPACGRGGDVLGGPRDEVPPHQQVSPSGSPPSRNSTRLPAGAARRARTPARAAGTAGWPGRSSVPSAGRRCRRPRRSHARARGPAARRRSRPPRRSSSAPTTAENTRAGEDTPASEPAKTVVVKSPIRVTGSCGVVLERGRCLPGRVRQRHP